MSTPNESEFNKQIKQKLQGLPVDDGAAIWSELEQQLDKKDSKKILFWWNPKTQLLLLFGLFIGGISAFYFYQNSSTPILANHQVKTITTQKPVESKSPVAPSTTIESQDITTNTATIAETKAEQQDTKNISHLKKSAETPTVSPKKEKNQKPNLSNTTAGATVSTTTNSTPSSESNTGTPKQDPPAAEPSDKSTSANPLMEKVLAQAQPMPAPSKDSTQSKVPAPAPTPDAPAPDTKKTERLPYLVLEAGMGLNNFSFDNFRRQNNPLSPCFSIHAYIPYGKYFSFVPSLSFINTAAAIQVNYIDSQNQNRYNVNALHFLQLGLNNRWHIKKKLSISAGIGYARFLRIYTLSNQVGYLPMSENRDSIPRSSWRREGDVSAFVARGDWNINYGIDYRFKNYGLAFRGITGLTDITINTPLKYSISNFSMNLTYWIPLKKK